MAAPDKPTETRLQALADAAERMRIRRYVEAAASPLRRQIAEIVEDAYRSAQAMARLEATLRSGPWV